MPKGSTLIRLGAILAFVIALICLRGTWDPNATQRQVCEGRHCNFKGTVILLLLQSLLANDFSTTVQLPNIYLPNNPLLMPRSILRRDVRQPLQSEAQSAANVVATAISPAISKFWSAASVATTIPDINTIKEIVSRNCLLGTKQFYLGFNNCTECNNLLLNLSNIVLEAVATFVGY